MSSGAPGRNAHQRTRTSVGTARVEGSGGGGPPMGWGARGSPDLMPAECRWRRTWRSAMTARYRRRERSGAVCWRARSQATRPPPGFPIGGERARAPHGDYNGAVQITGSDPVLAVHDLEGSADWFCRVLGC